MNELVINMKPLKYNSKEILIGILILPPVAIIINYFIFWQRLFWQFPDKIYNQLLWKTLFIFLKSLPW